MRKIKRFVPIAALCALLSVPHSASALGIILAVDIAQAPTDLTQAGFTQFVTGDVSAGGAPKTLTVDAYTVTIAAGTSIACFNGGTDFTGINSRGRTPIPDSGSYTQSSMMRERVVSLGSAGNLTTGIGTGLYLKIQGLAPGAKYRLQAWGVDHTGTPPALKNGTAAGFDATYEPTLSPLGGYTISGSPTSIADNNAYSIVGTFTADSNGTIIYKSIANIDGSGILNGFTLESVTPATIRLFGAVK